jgi:DNA-binding transcriptional LysR family regulator
MSATAVSNAIAGLESRLETRLFNRTTRSVALTDAGQRYVARGAGAAGDPSRQRRDPQRHREPAGTLRLNVPNHIGTLFLDQLLIDFMIRYPKMRVETVSEARMIDIVAEGYDAGIRLAESVPQDMIAVPLTGRSASSSPPRRTTLPVTAFRKRRTICCTSGDRHAYGPRRDLPLGAGASG